MTFRNTGFSLDSSLFPVRSPEGAGRSLKVRACVTTPAGAVEGPHLIIGNMFLYLWLRKASDNKQEGKTEPERQK